MSSPLGPRSRVRKPRIHVGVPTYGNTAALCLVSFGSFIGNGVARGAVTNIGVIEGAYIDRARNDLVRQALKNRSTHVMFVDQDMILPDNCLERLVAHKVHYVGGIYFGKDDLFTPVAYHLDPFHRIVEVEDTDYVPSSVELPEGLHPCLCGKPDPHLHSVGGLGMGCTLVTTALFRAIRDHFGDELWFSSKETGEDIHFAMRCKEVGVERFLDGFVQCGHIRNQLVTQQHHEWAKQNARRCSCGRVACYTVGKEDVCFEHREVI